MGFNNIRDFLPQALLRNRIKPQIAATSVLLEFKKIIKNVWGVEVMNIVEAKYVKDRILYVHCGLSTAASALKMAKKKIIEEVNKSCHESLIDDIVFYQ